MLQIESPRSASENLRVPVVGKTLPGIFSYRLQSHFSTTMEGNHNKFSGNVGKWRSVRKIVFRSDKRNSDITCHHTSVCWRYAGRCSLETMEREGRINIVEFIFILHRCGAEIVSLQSWNRCGDWQQVGHRHQSAFVVELTIHCESHILQCSGERMNRERVSRNNLTYLTVSLIDRYNWKALDTMYRFHRNGERRHRVSRKKTKQRMNMDS